MSPKTAYLKKTSEQRCREAFEKLMDWVPPREGVLLDGPANSNQYFSLAMAGSWIGWQACWKYLEGRLLKEIQS